MPKNKLLNHFDAYLSLNTEEREALYNRSKERKIKRKQYILQEGDVCRHYTFVVEGCLKMYYMDDKGTEHNIQFAAENDWIVDISSFHSEKSSQLFIEALEPTTLVQIEKSDLLFLYTHFPTFDRNYRVIIENKFVELQNRLLQNISSTAEVKYLSFLAQYPNLSNRLPNTQIASYLGITPEFLSTIRKKLTTRR